MSSYPVRTTFRQLAVVLVATVPLVVAACQPGSSPTAPAEPEVAPSTFVATTAADGESKVDVCHVDDDGLHFPIEVAEPSVDAHLGHGDWLVEAEICDGVDNDCDGAVDEGDVCGVGECPCYDASHLAAANFSSSATCVYDPRGGAFGAEVKIDDLANTFQFVQNLSDQIQGLTCAIFTFGHSDSRVGLTPTQWDACNALVFAEQQELGCL